MTTDLCVHEYAALARGGNFRSLKLASLDEADFDWLHSNEGYLAGGGEALLKPTFRHGRPILQVQNYVGLISLPSGKYLEILPKISELDDLNQSRFRLIKMLCKVYDLPFIKHLDADLQTQTRPLLEVLIGRFLQSVQILINRGLRSNYIMVRSEEKFLRGKLMTSAFLRKPPQMRTVFPVEYDDFLLSRPENKLVHWAVKRVYDWSREQSQRSHARKLLGILAEIPVSKTPEADYQLWQHGRLMAHYDEVKKWIKLILECLSPWSQRGDSSGISLLFPMERLFESYVAKVIDRQLASGYSLKAQSYSGFIAEHKGEKWFHLKPDLQILRNNRRVCVLDTKWKIIDSNDQADRYGISQSDMYQLFTYGQKCLSGEGSLFLIYPKHASFKEAVAPFKLSPHLNLWVVPFCLDTDRLIGEAWLKEAHYLISQNATRSRLSA